tara:strand:+ start:29116 stop:29745 length:630 start_codon:yes stop_codon:yes gene_type:complete
MKNLFNLLFAIIFIGTNGMLIAQESATTSENTASDYANRSPIYDYSEAHLNNTDSIPDFETKNAKLKITGTIYQSDGVTPAKDIILFIYQPDENGDYDMKVSNNKRYVHNRGWIKTDADGKYTFYTFVPGKYYRSGEFKTIHPVIKEPGKPEYNIYSFLFDDDPALTKSCRKKLERKGIDAILTLDKKEGLFVAKKDIVLTAEAPENNL